MHYFDEYNIYSLVSGTKSIRTPAQERLKRLQHDLKKEQKEKLTQKQSNNTRRQRNQEQGVAISKENEKGATKEKNVPKNKNSRTKSISVIAPIDSRKDCQPSTSKNTLLVNIETDKQTINNAQQKVTTTNKSKQKPPKNQSKKRLSSDATVETTIKLQKCSNQELPLKEKDPPNTDVGKNESSCNQQTDVVSGIGSGIGSGIVNKIKAICKSTFNSYRNAKKALSQKPLRPCIKQNNFKIPKKSTGAQHAANLTLQIREPENRTAYENGSESDISNNSNDISTTPMAILMKGTATPSNGDGTVDFKAIALTTTPSQLYGASHNRALPTYTHGSGKFELVIT